MAILFTSGWEVGVIMLPMIDFLRYEDLINYPEYGFTNPLAMEFASMGFAIWSGYFITCFYFCVIEPKVGFFKIPLVNFINTIVIVVTCSFTIYLFLSNLPIYLPELGDGKNLNAIFYLIVFLVISISVYSSSSIRYVKILSMTSTILFFLLILAMWIASFTVEQTDFTEIFNSINLMSNYFVNLNNFLIPINLYHEFYLFWWYSWYIMIGQFLARFVSGIKTYQLFLMIMIIPSIPLALWFSVIFIYYQNGINTVGIYNYSMVFVGTLFVINSLDSLIRLYTDNLNFTPKRLGKSKYIILNILSLSGLTLMYNYDFLEIEWIGAIVIGLVVSCLIYIFATKRNIVSNIKSSPAENNLDFDKVNAID
jgi:choline-glycine betaine transporter|tara:strand:- start:6488 stop:7588 length:1101 start_codon:yes stop_codon:yes gene_type:complete